MSIYAIFGLVTSAVPLVARRLARPLQPAAGGGLVLLASLGLLLFLSTGSIAPFALWSLALLLAILNAGLFIESAAVRMPVLSQVGSVLSWAILGLWWYRDGGSGRHPSQHRGRHRADADHARRPRLGARSWEPSDGPPPRSSARAPRSDCSATRFSSSWRSIQQWSLPPWPLFGSLAVATLAVSVTSLATRGPAAARVRRRRRGAGHHRLGRGGRLGVDGPARVRGDLGLRARLDCGAARDQRRGVRASAARPSRCSSAS